jgi:hypothetical protein
MRLYYAKYKANNLIFMSHDDFNRLLLTSSARLQYDVDNRDRLQHPVKCDLKRHIHLVFNLKKLYLDSPCQ